MNKLSIAHICIIYDVMHPLLERISDEIKRYKLRFTFMHWSKMEYIISNSFMITNMDIFSAIYLDRLAEHKLCYHSQLLQMTHVSNIRKRMINYPEAYQLARDKSLAAIIMAKNGLPIPETYILHEIEQVKKVLHNKCDYVVAKSLLGFCAQEIQIFNKYNIPVDVISDWINRDGQIVLQLYVENPSRFIWRCDVVAGKVKVCNKRYAYNMDEKISICNGSIGGEIEIFDMDKIDIPATQLAVWATGVFGLLVAGVDIIEDSKGELFILEVNPEPDILMKRYEFPDAIAELLKNKSIEGIG